MEDDPEVEEIEVNTEGQWRPEGRGGRWRDISEEPGAYQESREVMGTP